MPKQTGPEEIKRAIDWSGGFAGFEGHMTGRAVPWMSNFTLDDDQRSLRPCPGFKRSWLQRLIASTNGDYGQNNTEDWAQRVVAFDARQLGYPGVGFAIVDQRFEDPARRILCLGYNPRMRPEFFLNRGSSAPWDPESQPVLVLWQDSNVYSDSAWRAPRIGRVSAHEYPCLVNEGRRTHIVSGRSDPSLIENGQHRNAGMVAPKLRPRISTFSSLASAYQLFETGDRSDLWVAAESYLTARLSISSGGYIQGPLFTGAGLNDATFTGTYTGTSQITIKVEIQTDGTPDTFRWYIDGVLQASNINVAITPTLLGSGISVTFGASTGHTVGNYWETVIRPFISTAPYAWPDETSKAHYYIQWTYDGSATELKFAYQSAYASTDCDIIYRNYASPSHIVMNTVTGANKIGFALYWVDIQDEGRKEYLPAGTFAFVGATSTGLGGTRVEIPIDVEIPRGRWVWIELDWSAGIANLQSVGLMAYKPGVGADAITMRMTRFEKWRSTTGSGSITAQGAVDGPFHGTIFAVFTHIDPSTGIESDPSPPSQPFECNFWERALKFHLHGETEHWDTKQKLETASPPFNRPGQGNFEGGALTHAAFWADGEFTNVNASGGNRVHVYIAYDDGAVSEFGAGHGRNYRRITPDGGVHVLSELTNSVGLQYVIINAGGQTSATLASNNNLIDISNFQALAPLVPFKGRRPAGTFASPDGKNLVVGGGLDWAWGRIHCQAGIDVIRLVKPSAEELGGLHYGGSGYTSADDWRYRFESYMEGMTLTIEDAADAGINQPEESSIASREYLILQILSPIHARIGRKFSPQTETFTEKFDGTTGFYRYKIAPRKNRLYHSVNSFALRSNYEYFPIQNNKDISDMAAGDSLLGTVREGNVTYAFTKQGVWMLDSVDRFDDQPGAPTRFGDPFRMEGAPGAAGERCIVKIPLQGIFYITSDFRLCKIRGGSSEILSATSNAWKSFFAARVHPDFIRAAWGVYNDDAQQLTFHFITEGVRHQVALLSASTAAYKSNLLVYRTIVEGTSWTAGGVVVTVNTGATPNTYGWTFEGEVQQTGIAITGEMQELLYADGSGSDIWVRFAATVANPTGSLTLWGNGTAWTVTKWQNAQTYEEGREFGLDEEPSGPFLIADFAPAITLDLRTMTLHPLDNMTQSCALAIQGEAAESGVKATRLFAGDRFGFINEIQRADWLSLGCPQAAQTFLIVQGGASTAKVATFSAPVFIGTGNNDMVLGGTSDAPVWILIGAAETFSWFKGGTLMGSGIAITGAVQSLGVGLTIKFAAAAGHNALDFWVGLPTFTGAGLNDLVLGAYYKLGEAQTLTVTVAAEGTPDTFDVYVNGVKILAAEAMTGAAQHIGTNLPTLTFLATTGHTAGESWVIQCRSLPTGGNGLDSVYAAHENHAGAADFNRVASNTFDTATMNFAWDAVPAQGETLRLGPLTQVIKPQHLHTEYSAALKMIRFKKRWDTEAAPPKYALDIYGAKVMTGGEEEGWVDMELAFDDPDSPVKASQIIKASDCQKRTGWATVKPNTSSALGYRIQTIQEEGAIPTRLSAIEVIEVIEPGEGGR